MEEQILIYLCEVCNHKTTDQDEMEEHSFTSDYADVTAVRSFYNNEITPIASCSNKTGLPLASTSRQQQGINDGDYLGLTTMRSIAQNKEDPFSEKKWNTDLTLFFIDKIKENDEKFDRDIKKFVWQNIAKLCTEFAKRTITSTQCDNKWRSLKRTYKNILVHNSTSGKNRRNWEFFDVIHDLMHKKPEINPVATCSNHMGLQVASTSKQDDINECASRSASPSINSSPSTEYESSFIRKRKQKQNLIDVRHQEKMARLDKFNDLFEKLIDKMPDPKK